MNRETIERITKLEIDAELKAREEITQLYNAYRDKMDDDPADRQGHLFSAIANAYRRGVEDGRETERELIKSGYLTERGKDAITVQTGSDNRLHDACIKSGGVFA
jgi:hypothetical protein